MTRPTRLVVVQALYQREITQNSLERMLEDFEPLARLSGKKSADADFDMCARLLAQTIQHQKALDEAIATALPASWQLERLDKVLLVLLRVALIEKGDKFALRDYVDIAYSLLDEKTAGLANAMLDKLGAGVSLDEKQSR